MMGTNPNFLYAVGHIIITVVCRNHTVRKNSVSKDKNFTFNTGLLLEIEFFFFNTSEWIVKLYIYMI